MTRDMTVPTIALTSPSEGSYINLTNDTTTFVLSGSCSEAGQSVVIKVDGVQNGAGGSCANGSFSAAIDSTLLNAGNHSLVAEITDVAGNLKASVAVQVTRDVVGPSIAITGPTSGEYVNAITDSLTYAIAGTCSEAGQIVTIKLDNLASGTGGSCDGTNFIAAVDSTVLSAGIHSIIALISDSVGNNTTSAPISINRKVNAPTITEVSSSVADGAYGSGVIPIIVNFSEPVSVIGTPELELNITPTLKKAFYVSGSSSSALTFNYTIGVGDSAADLDAASLSSLTTPGGNIQDVAGNLATLTLPLVPNSLGSSKDIVIDTVAPSAPSALSLVNPVVSPGTISTPSIAIDGVVVGDTVKLFDDNTCSVLLATALNSSGSSITLTLLSPLAIGTHTLFANSTDNAGNVSPCSAASVSYEYTGPLNPPSVIVENSYGFEGDSINFKISISTAKATDVTFDWAVQSDTASVTDDLSVTSGSGTILAGTTEASVASPVVVDALNENPEQFKIVISNINGAIGFETEARGLLYDPVKNVMSIDAVGISSSYKGLITSDGALKTMGGGYPGDGSYITSRETPSSVLGMNSGVSQFEAGSGFRCALQSGQVKCWGSNTLGQLGVGNYVDRASPITVSLPSAAVSLSVGERSVCALLDTQAVYCWGYNNMYVNNDPLWSTFATSPLPTTFTAGSGVIKVASDRSISSRCVLFADGSVKCWGENYYGQLGDGTTTSRSSPVTVTGLTSGVTDILLSERSAFALMDDGTVKAWGSNSGGVLGIGGFANQKIPVTIPGLTNVTHIMHTTSLTCARKLDGSIYCWGIGQYVGTGTTDMGTTFTSPVLILPPGSSQSLARTAPCYITNDGKPKCWGTPSSGHILSDRTVHTQTGYYANVDKMGRSVSATSACDIVGGDIYCRGNINFGYPYNVRPVLKISGPALQVGTGTGHSCYLESSGQVNCWAWNASYGQMGRGDWSYSTTPQYVTNLPLDVTNLSVGAYHTCAISGAGQPYCWGYNNYGQLGDGTTTNKNSATLISGLANVVRVSAGRYHTCGLLTDNSVRCWGNNASGQLGTNGVSNSSVPVTPIGLTGGVLDIQSGYDHSCALMIDGTVKCWGSGLAIGFVNYQFTPAVVPGLANITKVAAGGSSSCFLRNDQKVFCLGKNLNFQVSPISNNSGNFIPLTEITEVAGEVIDDIVVNSSSTCVHLSNGKTKCWGEDSADSAGCYTPQFLVAHRPGVLRIVAMPNNSSGYESENVNFQLALTEELAEPTLGATVNYTTADDTAVAGLDYSSITGSVTLSPGENFVNLPPITTNWHYSTSSFSFFLNLTPISGILPDNLSQYFTLLNAEPSTVSLDWGTLSNPVSNTCLAVYLYTNSSGPIPIKVNLSDNTVYGDFYSDSACTQAINSTELETLTGLSSTFYYKAVIPESITLTATSPAMNYSANGSFVATGPAKLTIEGLQDMVTGICSYPMTASARNSANALYNVTNDTEISFSGLGAATLYTDSSCTVPVTNLTIATGSSQTAPFYLKSAVAESLIIVASKSWIPTSGTLPITIRGLSAPNQLSFMGSNSVYAGSCTPYFTALYDSGKNTAYAQAETIITFTDSGTGTVYADSSCLNATTSITIPTSSSYKQFWFRGSAAELVTLNATSVPVVTVNPMQILVLPNPNPVKAAWLNDSPTLIQTNVCQPFSYALLNSNNEESFAVVSQLVYFSSLSGTFYLNSSCSTIITGTTVAGGKSRGIVYYKNASPTVNLELVITINANSNVHVVTVKSPPTQLSIAGVASTTVDQCVPLNIATLNSSAQSTTVDGATTVTLSATGSTQFFGDSLCAGAITQTILDAGTAAKTVYYRDSVAESSTLTAAVTGWTSGTFATTFNLRYLSWSGATSAATSTCTAITINSLNSNGSAYSVPSSLTVNLTGAGSGFFYSGNSCTGGQKITSTQIASGTSAKIIYIKDASVEVLTITASATGYTNASKQFTIGSPTVTQSGDLVISGAAVIPQGGCIPYAITTYNSSGGELTLTSNLTVSLSESGNGTIYSDSNCTATTSSLAIASGSSSGNFYFRDYYYRENIYQDFITLTATATGFSTSMFNGTIIAGPAHHLTWDKSLGLTNNTCVKVKVSVRDAQENKTIINLVSATTLDLVSSGNATGTFYSDSNCAATTSTASIGAGLSDAEVYFKTASLGFTTLTSVPNPANGVLQAVWIEELSRPVTAMAIDPVSSETICVIIEQEIFCAGSNGTGALGVGDQAPHQGFVKVPIINNAISLAATSGGMCAQLSDGTVKCWGSGTSGKIGDGTYSTRTSPVTISGLTNVTKLASTHYSVCAVDGGAAKCWGQNAGTISLGLGVTSGSINTPTQVVGLTSGVTDIAIGGVNGCAIVDEGLKCWGENYYGQLGNGTTTASGVPVDVTAFPPGSGINKIRIGPGYYTVAGTSELTKICVISAVGRLQCWGRNTSSQLGTGTTLATITSPTDFLGMESGAIDVGLSSNVSCAYNQAGKTLCAGTAYYHEMGIYYPGNIGFSTPVSPIGLENNVLRGMAIGNAMQSGSATLNSYCVILSSGRLKCWGHFSEWMNDLKNRIFSPTVLAKQPPAGTISQLASSPAHLCARINDGSVQCWGSNAYGQIGNGQISSAGYIFDPYTVNLNAGAATALKVSVQTTDSCAMLSDGTMKCWGSNSYGQLGTGNTTNSYTPVLVSNLNNVSDIALGSSRACAVNNGSVWCWGINTVDVGGGVPGPATLPVAISGIPAGTIDSLQAGEEFTCVLVNGEVWCWGRSVGGRLGDGNSTGGTTFSASKVINLPAPVSKLKVGASFSCAILTDSSLWCWGYNVISLPNYFPIITFATPVKVFASGIKEIYMNNNGINISTCAVRTDDYRLCWGYNSDGQLGVGSSTVLDRQASENFTYQLLPSGTISDMVFGSNYQVILKDGLLYGAGSQNAFIFNQTKPEWIEIPSILAPIR
jgi:alpha-tubulin suppressor-like RCC1 family protein